MLDQRIEHQLAISNLFGERDVINYVLLQTN